MEIQNSNIVNNLNERQHEAVTSPACNLLILAGAGSGKTRVLVHRIAWLIQEEDVSPFGLLAVTFTNKAAAEMRSRVETLLERPVSGMWIGTFHSLCHRLLRLHWQEAGLDQNFQILDSDDQLRLIKRVLRSLNIDDERYAPKKVQGFINSKKDSGLRARHIEPGHHIDMRKLVEIYSAYEDVCQHSHLVDFAELLLRSHELWLEHPALLEHYRERFRHVLVDEFQDTNTIQYAWLRILVGKENHIMLVGDDDQSIYGWRGAKFENIYRVSKDFPDIKTIRLEQNYRSTSTILKAANAVIACNQARLGKELWTTGNEGDPISVYGAFNEVDEARHIAEQVEVWCRKGNRRDEVAVLYRSNAQSRILEEAFIRIGMPYRVYGGFRFFERAEIKDAMAYLRLIVGRHDDAAFERIVNTPTRGIGDRTLMFLRDHARASSVSLWAAAQNIIAENQLPARAHQALCSFMDLIEEMAVSIKELMLHEQCEQVLHQSGLLAHYSKERSEKALARVENLEELITAARQFTPPDDTDMPMLSAFIVHAALEAGEGQAEQFEDCVQLMTLHSAKGLEFPLVFIAGVEEGLFPHPISLDGAGGLEEERRLFYVGLTRAKREVRLSHAEVRHLHGKEQYHFPSRFIKEIPKDLIHEVRQKTQVSRPFNQYASTSRSSSRSSYSSRSSHSSRTSKPTKKYAVYDDSQKWKIGQRVLHKKFGEGIVVNYEGSGTQARIQIEFKKVGTKWLIESLAKLQPA